MNGWKRWQRYTTRPWATLVSPLLDRHLGLFQPLSLRGNFLCACGWVVFLAFQCVACFSLKNMPKIAEKKEILLGSFFLWKKREKREERILFFWNRLHSWALGSRSAGKMGFGSAYKPSSSTCRSMGGRLKQTNTHFAG